MSYKVTNISGGLIVCDLATVGATLRLNNKQSKTIKDTEITSHIKNLIAKGLLLSEEILVENQVIKNTVVKHSKKSKEEKED